jgi:hypothetical protein
MDQSHGLVIRGVASPVVMSPSLPVSVHRHTLGMARYPVHLMYESFTDPSAHSACYAHVWTWLDGNMSRSSCHGSVVLDLDLCLIRLLDSELVVGELVGRFVL